MFVIYEQYQYRLKRIKIPRLSKAIVSRYVTQPQLDLVAPTNNTIVCFRFRTIETAAEQLKALNTEIMLRLQDEGTAVISDTTVHGEHCLRVAINNHRMQRKDLDLFLEEVVRLGQEIFAGGTTD